MKQRLRLFIEDEIAVIVAAAAAFSLIATGRVKTRRIPEVVDWTLLLVLFALLVGVELLRESNLLERAVAGFVGQFRTARSFTAALVVITGALSAIVTNDVALFVVIPFAVLAGRRAGFQAKNAAILAIGAANLIGCLTPVGNPQNLFLHQRTGWSASQFILTMLPFVVWSAAGLMIAVRLLEPAVAFALPASEPMPVDRSRAISGVICLTLVLLQVAHVLPAWPAAVAAALLTALLLRPRWSEMDLSILPLFFFAFIVVEGLRTLPVYAMFARLPDEPHGLALYSGVILSSQILSNVPSAVLFAPIAEGQWRTLLYAVSAGGCGTIIASLANLLGWQIYTRETGREEGFLKALTVISFVFLIWTGIGGWFLSLFPLRSLR